jgi:hypothetical protein
MPEPTSSKPDDKVRAVSEGDMAGSRATESEVGAKMVALHMRLARIRGWYISQALTYESLVEMIVAHHLAPGRTSLFKAVVFEDMTMYPKIRMLKRVMKDLGVDGDFKAVRRGLDDCMRFRNMLAHGQVSISDEALDRPDTVTILVYDDRVEREVTLTQADVMDRIRSERYILEGLLELGANTGAVE